MHTTGNCIAAHVYTTVNVQTYLDNYLQKPRFWFSLLLFGIRVTINWQSDDILRNLRSKTKSSKPKGSGYFILYGGFFTSFRPCIIWGKF